MAHISTKILEVILVERDSKTEELTELRKGSSFKAYSTYPSVYIMIIPQQKLREIVFQFLYSLDITDQNEESLKNLLAKELKSSKQGIEKARLRAAEIQKKKEVLDHLITSSARSYAFERIPSVERNILRLGIFELYFDPTIPPKVAIAEAIRLARKFSSPESAHFINAIMDFLYKEMEKNTTETSTDSQAVNDI